MEREWAEGKEEISREFEPGDRFVPLLVDITFFVSAIRAYRMAKNARERRDEIQKILAAGEWYLYYEDKRTGRRVLSESICMEFEHERQTAIKLAQMNYDVVFAPVGMFKRDQRKFDVYLLRDTIVLEADMKCVTSTNPDTIANRIISGSHQASRIVLDIRSDISAKDLIDGLRSGTGKNKLLKELLIFYKNRFYVLPVKLIWSKNIFKILKSEKGYT